MPSQIFVVTRPPEAAPIDFRRVCRLISIDRPDSEWDVHECELQQAKLVDCVAAKALRERGGEVDHE